MRLVRLISLVAIGLPLLLILLVIVSLERDPLLSGGTPARPEELAQIGADVGSRLRAHDPRRLTPGQMGQVVISEQDLNLLAQQGLARLMPGTAARIDLKPGGVLLWATLTWPLPWPHGYLNLQAKVAQTPGQPTIHDLRIGRWHLPSWLAQTGLVWVDQLARLDADYVAAVGSIQDYRFTEDALRVRYRWDPVLVKRLGERGRDQLIGQEERDRILVYAHKLAEVSRAADDRGPLSLASFAQPLFALAQTRSLRGGDAVAENRALILVLGFYLGGRSAAEWVGGAGKTVEKPVQQDLRLRGRRDLAQHFVISALLATPGDSELADAVGLFKEILDKRGGSGFSFPDLAADRAGVRFAELATVSASQAARIQRIFAAGVSEDIFMPEVRDLPEFLHEREFRLEFGGFDDTRYRAMAQDIEARIAMLPLYRESEPLPTGAASAERGS
ncbi:hypothetical protein Thiowin_01277 [Thiorhodovibrio winogradskyi]|uniref:Uncharacterized protein n=1 Tax=Thiorhodovibrio winogradskyi TaxID=77007 RepID=A0ABZ0S737_9GAMM|nr:hypothetical protein [Thiorhodovibrio winogradskyi]